MHSAKTFCEYPQKLLSAPLSFLPSPLLLCPLPRENSPGRWTTITTGENQDAHTKRQRQNRRSRIFQEDGGELPPLRGLALRIQWGKAHVMRVIDAVKAKNEALDVVFEAMLEGYGDFASGKHTPPHMFSDVPELVSAWHSGWAQAAGVEETSNCACCQSGSGEPCPYHD